MTHEAMIVALDDNFEELVIVEILGSILTCFASVCPYEIEIGKKYQIELHAVFFEEVKVRELDELSSDEITKLSNFSYLVSGKLIRGDFLSKDIIFKDDDDFVDMRYLEGKRAEITIDRLDAHFL